MAASSVASVESPLAGAAPRRAARASRHDYLPLAIFLATVTVALTNLGDGLAYMDDEGTYVAQATAVLTDGTLAPYEYNYDHPPFGWIMIAALMWVPQLLMPHADAILHGRLVMGVLFGVSATLIYLIVRRLDLSRVAGLIGSAAFVLSPLALRLGRQVYLDNVAVVWVLLAVWLVLDPRARLWQHIGAGAALGIAVLAKAPFLLFAPAVLLALLDRPRWAARSFSLTGLIVTSVSAVTFYPLMALLSSELFPSGHRVSLLETATFQLVSRAGSGSILDPTSARHTLALDWIRQDPLLFTLGLIGAAAALFSRGTRWLLPSILCMALPVVVGSGYLPAMHVVGIVPLLAIGVAVGAGMLHRFALSLMVRVAPDARARRVGSAVVSLALLAAALVLILPDRSGGRQAMVTGTTNSDWKATVAWVERYVDDSGVVVVPFSMYPDLTGPTTQPDEQWRTIALEKVDLDSQYAEVHPNGWRDIDYIVDSPSVREDVQELDLTTVEEALANSVEVVRYGEWSIRRVNDA